MAIELQEVLILPNSPESPESPESPLLDNNQRATVNKCDDYATQIFSSFVFGMIPFTLFTIFLGTVENIKLSTLGFSDIGVAFVSFGSSCFFVRKNFHKICG